MFSVSQRQLASLTQSAARQACRSSLRRLYATPSDGPPITQTNRAEITMKRFWKKVDLENKADGLVVTLDKRALKTPSGSVLVIPPSKRMVAALIAHEWENQDKVLKPHALPVTSLASRAVDGLAERKTREEVHAALLKYFDTDTVCYHADSPTSLVELQNLHWAPLLTWVREKFGIEVTIYNSILGGKQPEKSKEKLLDCLRSLDPWELAALERVTYTTKSFIIALALVHGHLNAEQAAQAAHVEVNSQIKKWGEVEDSHDVDFHDIRRQLSSAACLLGPLRQ